VHHVELNRAGWWDKALNRLVLGIIWLTDGTPNVSEIQDALKSEFDIALSQTRLDLILTEMESKNDVIKLADNRYRIPEKVRSSFEKEIAESDADEKEARGFFILLAKKMCPSLDAVSIWSKFENIVLVPLIRDIGATTYNLIVGGTAAAYSPYAPYAENFVSHFDQTHQETLKKLVATFLDPKRSEVRRYITRMLHAQLCVRSSGLSSEVLEKLKSSMGKSVKFRLFVDTNFLFSLLGLHENPSNASANELKDLLVELKNNPEVELCIMPKTIDEAKTAIAAAKAQVVGIPRNYNITKAALHIGLAGMSEKFFAEQHRLHGQLTASDWFDPYLDNFLPLAKAAGVNLCDVGMDEYSLRQDVIDDIHDVMEHERKRAAATTKNQAYRLKSYDKVAHDIILWHVVKDKRPSYVESPSDAKEWIITIDFRLLRFDQYKLKKSGANVPICLHPSTFIQLLQFWIPRSQKFEEAVLSGLRLPFLFQEFDAAAERLSLTIIRRIGRFDGSDKIPSDTLVRVILNDGLRARIAANCPEDEETQLVRDTLIEDMRTQAEQEKVRAEQLTVLVENKSSALIKSTEERKEKDAQIKHLQTKLHEQEEKTSTATKALSRLAAEHLKFESKITQMENDRLHSRALFIYCISLVCVIAISLLAGRLASLFMRGLSIGVAVFTFISAHLILELLVRKNECLLRLWPFKQVKRFRKWLWGIAIALVIGVTTILVAESIQSHSAAFKPKDAVLKAQGLAS
jgi:hypothetical protein